jgi:hypothetical protein
MRLWSLNPSLLDPKGLVAVWREGLLAKNVLMNKTKGYKHHPQLDRFKKTDNPVNSINLYLSYILKESKRRNYSFDGSKLFFENSNLQIEVTSGQLLYEVEFLKNKLKNRNSIFLESWNLNNSLNDFLHPFFKLIDGDVEYWEKRK